MRIVSLVPAATEMLVMLGLADQIVGVSHECELPAFLGRYPRVTRSLLCPEGMPIDIDALMQQRSSERLSVFEIDGALLVELRPDLVITHSPLNACAVTPVPLEQIAALLPGDPLLVPMSPCSIEEVLADFNRLGQITERPVAAARAIAESRRRLDAVREQAARMPQRPRVLFLESINPPCCAGHANSGLVRTTGGVDVLGNRRHRESRSLTAPCLEDAHPDLVIVAPCDVPVERAMWDWETLPEGSPLASVMLRDTPKVCFLDGCTLFKHPGPRLISGLEQIARAVHHTSLRLGAAAENASITVKPGIPAYRGSAISGLR